MKFTKFKNQQHPLAQHCIKSLYWIHQIQTPNCHFCATINQIDSSPNVVVLLAHKIIASHLWIAFVDPTQIAMKN
jgi:hypothetical protein